MSKEHELKTDPGVFQQSWDDLKTFELRLDDRDYSVGDTLMLRETAFSGAEMKAGCPLKYTGRAIQQHVNTVLHGPIYGLQDGWVIMSVENWNSYEDYEVWQANK